MADTQKTGIDVSQVNGGLGFNQVVAGVVDMGNNQAQPVQQNTAGQDSKQGQDSTKGQDTKAEATKVETTQDTTQPKTIDITPKEPTLQEKVKADTDKKEIEIQAAALVKKQMAAQNNTTQSPAKLTEEQQKRIEAIYKDMETAVANNASFLIKTDLSLRGIIELIAIMQVLNKFYIYHVELLKDNRNSIENAVIDIQSANEKFDFMVSQAGTYIYQVLKEMDNANNTSLELRKELEILHDATQKDLLETKDDLAKTIETYEKLQLLEATMGNLDKAIKDAELIVEKHAKILKDMQEFVSVELTKAQAALMLKKEEHERDLQATRDTFIQKFNELLRELETKGQELVNNANDINIKTTGEINTIANNRLAELKKLDVELDASMKALKDESIADIESKKVDSLDELKNKMLDLLATLETKKQEKIQEIENKKNESLNAVEGKKNDATAAIEAKKQEVDKNVAAFNQNVNDAKQEISIKKNEIDNSTANFMATMNNIKNEIDTKKIDSLNELENRKQDALMKMQDDSNEKLQALSEKSADTIKKVDDKKNEFLTESETKKQDVLKEFVNVKTQIIETKKEMNDKKTETLAKLESESNKKLEALENKKVEAVAAVDSKKTDSINTLDTNKESTLKNINDLKDAAQAQADKNKSDLQTQQDEFLKEISEMQKDYLTELQGSEFGRLKDMVIRLLKPPELFEKELVKVEISSTQEWTPPAGLKNIYVMLRGGAANDKTTNMGLPSSFGQYLTCLGGKGQQYGAGQYGEVKSCYITLPNSNPINVTINNGGICIISYNRIEMFDINQFNTAFIRDADIPYLPNGAVGMDRNAFKKTITDVAELNVVKNIEEIHIDTTDISDTDIGKLAQIPEFSTKIKDRRSLELYIASELVINRMATEATKRHLKYAIR